MTRKSSRYGYRDATIILIAYRHGLRASEVSATCSGIRSNSTPGACLAGLAFGLTKGFMRSKSKPDRPFWSTTMASPSMQMTKEILAGHMLTNGDRLHARPGQLNAEDGL